MATSPWPQGHSCHCLLVKIPEEIVMVSPLMTLCCQTPENRLLDHMTHVKRVKSWLDLHTIWCSEGKDLPELKQVTSWDKTFPRVPDQTRIPFLTVASFISFLWKENALYLHFPISYKTSWNFFWLWPFQKESHYDPVHISEGLDVPDFTEIYLEFYPNAWFLNLTLFRILWIALMFLNNYFEITIHFLNIFEALHFLQRCHQLLLHVYTCMLCSKIH